MSIRIGETVLKHGLGHAPMAGVTDRTFRLLCKRFGAEYTVSEMVSAKALCYEQRSHRKEAALNGTAPLAAVLKSESPMAVQIFGSEPEFMAEAAQMIEACSYKGCISEIPPAAIDINMGCPVRKITGNGEGSALMKDPELAGKIVNAVSKAVKIPVTVKIRTGIDENSINAVDCALAAEAGGADALCIHGRTRKQMYAGSVDRKTIAKVKKSLHIPLIANGDINSAEDALSMLSDAGADGIAIGRGAVGNPFLFDEIRAALKGESYSPPTLSERIDTALLQLKIAVEDKGERVAVTEARKQIALYLKGFRGAPSVRGEINKALTYKEVESIFLSLK